MKVAFIGLGNMGLGMARNLAMTGHAVTGFDLSETALESARAAGIAIAESGPGAVTEVDVVVTVLPAGEQVLETYRGEHGHDGLLAAATAGTLFMDCSTIGVDQAREAAELARDAGHHAIDAPISGGTVGADAGTLTFMVGGDADDFHTARPLLDAMGAHAVHCGINGTGLIAKICNNMLLGINQIAAAEAFTLGRKLGMDPRMLFEVLSSSSGQSWSVTTNSPVPDTVPTAPSSNGFKPGAVPGVLAKDLKLAAKAMANAEFHCEFGSRAGAIYQEMADTEVYGRKDFSAVIDYLQQK